MKILHLTTWKEKCGIAGYAESLIKSLDSKGIENEVFPIDKIKLQYMTLQEIKDKFKDFCEVANNYNLVHIQHEHSFFHGSHSFSKSIEIFSDILSRLKERNVVVTFHTEPIFYHSPRVIFENLLRNKKQGVSEAIQSLEWRVKIAPYFHGKNGSCKAILHTKRSRLKFISSGFNSNAISINRIGFDKRAIATELCHSERDYNSVVKHKDLGFPEDCRLLSIFGFISSYKGYAVAIKALRYLPSKYYLAIIGGPHPEDTTGRSLEDILVLIEKLKLQDRVLVTGFVDFKTLDRYHKATDICLAPYIAPELSSSAALTWAITSGKPVIVSKIPAFVELNQEAECLLMTALNSPRELAWQILKLDSDPNLNSRLVKNALEYSETYSWDKISDSTIEIYQSMFNK